VGNDIIEFSFQAIKIDGKTNFVTSNVKEEIQKKKHCSHIFTFLNYFYYYLHNQKNVYF